MSNPFNPILSTPKAHNFSDVARIKNPRTAIKATARFKTMFDIGKLVPLGQPLEIIPGSTIKFDVSALCRFPQPPLVPFMDNLYLSIHWFFVPCRLLWSNWEKFMGAKDNPSDSTTYTVPVVTGPAAGFAVESVYDYMGIPINMTKNVNALPLRAYNKIYNDHYKDQNIINNATTNTGNGPDTDTNYTLRVRGKRADYFTTALPAPQFGTAASFSLTGTAPISGIAVADTAAYSSAATGYVDSLGADPPSGSDWFAIPANNIMIQGDEPETPTINAVLTNVGALTISEFRETIQLQALAEIENRGGHRYIEILYSVFGVISPDFRLQISEYLGGSTVPIYTVPVAATDNQSGALGALGAYTYGFQRGNGFTKSFTEHGYVIGIASTYGDQTYSQGLHRIWTRQSRYDFFNPYLQNIGDQAVLQQEIYLSDANSSADNTVFGYQERYSEYMYLPSLITGKLRPAYSSPLDYWHFSPEYGSAPTLSQTFIEVDTPVDRVLSATTQPDFVMDVNIDAVMVLPMAMHSIPGFLPRF